MTTADSNTTYKREHKFNLFPHGYRVGMGIPAYLSCSCGKRWYSYAQRPQGYCPMRRND